MFKAINLIQSNKILKAAFSTKIKKVGMVGLGLMGHGIAQAAATAGYEVVAMDMKKNAVEDGIKKIDQSVAKVFGKMVKKDKLSSSEAEDKKVQVMSRIYGTTEMNDLKDCDLVIEAIIENVDIKTDFYKKLGSLVKKDGILASNTSSLPIQVMADPSARPDKMVGLHFFNPVQMMKLVEVIRTDQTDPKVFEACKEWVVSIGKTPVSCKDTPGFIVNRLLVPNIAQALLMLERGDATQDDIDLSMQLGAGHPMGPITLADYVGLDTCLSILDGWVQNFPNEKAFIVPDILREKVKQGHLGRKSGQGFYKWDGYKKIN